MPKRKRNSTSISDQMVRELVREKIERSLSQPPSVAFVLMTSAVTGAVYVVFSQDMDVAVNGEPSAFSSDAGLATTLTWNGPRVLAVVFGSTVSMANLLISANNGLVSALAIGHVPLAGGSYTGGAIS